MQFIQIFCLVFLILINVSNIYGQEEEGPKLFYANGSITVLNARYIFQNNPDIEIEIPNRETIQIGGAYNFGYGFNFNVGIHVLKRIAIGISYNYTFFNIPEKIMDTLFDDIDIEHYNDVSYYDYLMFNGGNISKYGGRINFHNIGIKFKYSFNYNRKITPYLFFNPWYSIVAVKNIYLFLENQEYDYSREFKLLGFLNNGNGFGEETGLGGMYRIGDNISIFLEISNRLQFGEIDLERGNTAPFSYTVLYTTISKLNSKIGILYKFKN